jgi:hypothetical protein
VFSDGKPDSSSSENFPVTEYRSSFAAQSGYLPLPGNGQKRRSGMSEYEFEKINFLIADTDSQMRE